MRHFKEYDIVGIGPTNEAIQTTPKLTWGEDEGTALTSFAASVFLKTTFRFQEKQASKQTKNKQHVP